MFVSFGSDDNGYSGLEGSGGGGGVHWLTELFASRTNPPGSENALTFDGAPIHYSFYVNTIYITPDGVEDPAYVRRAWREALDGGHEIGVHTHSHPHGREMSVREWEAEIERCIGLLTSAEDEGIGVRRDRLFGFRTPFIEYNDEVLTAARKKGMIYDCSIEEGVQEGEDGRNFVWPYRLDRGSPGNDAVREQWRLPRVTSHPGLWEIPAYVFIVPPDDRCGDYGIQPGLRERLRQRNSYFNTDQGKITGFDWNLWFEFGMSKEEFLATLKYTFDLRLEGNRCPMTVGVHGDIYADKSSEQPPSSTPQERRDALQEFLDCVLSHPDVRVVSAKELLDWLRSPASLR